MRKQKLIHLVAILFALILFSCSKDSNPVDNSNDGNGSAITSISGRILTWTNGTNKVLKLSIYKEGIYYNFASSSIDENGNFNLNTLDEVPSDFLITLDTFFSNLGLTISNPSVKLNSEKAKFKIFEQGSDSPIREISREREQSQSTETVGDYYCSYRYSNGTSKITGSYTENNGTEIVQVDLNLLKGWNKVFYELIEINSTTKKYKLSNIEPEGGVWR